MFVHSAQTPGAMLELKNRRTKIPATSRMRNTHLAHLGRGPRYQLGLRFFDVVLPNQHFTSS